MERKKHLIFTFGEMNVQNKKSAFVLFLLFVLFSLLLSAIAFIPINSASSFHLVRASQLFAFLIAGIIYLSLLYKYIFIPPLKNMVGSWLYTILLTLFIGTALSTLYRITGNSLIMALGSSSAFLFPFIIAQVWYLYRRIMEEEELLQTNSDVEKLEEQKIVDEFKDDQEEIASKQERLKIKLELEEMRSQRKETFDKKIILEQEKSIQKERESFENKLKKELEQFKLNLKEGVESELRQEMEIRIRNQEQIFENKLKITHEEIRQNEKEIYKNKLQLDLEQLNEKQKDIYEKKLKDSREELIGKEKILIEIAVKKAQEEIKQKTKEDYDNKLQHYIEEINKNQQAQYEKKLKESQEQYIEEEKIAFEIAVRKAQEEIRQKEKEAYADKLTQEQEEMGKEKEVFRNNLRKEQEEAIKEEKNNSDTEAKINDAPIFIKKIGNEAIKEADTPINKSGQNHDQDKIVIGNDDCKEKIWYYRTEETVQSAVILLNSVVLYISLSLKSAPLAEEQFMFSAPLEMKLGEFFKYFIDKKTKNDKLDIDIFDDEHKPFGWKFYTKGVLQFKKRELDPSLSLRRNRIKELSVIFVRRI